MSLTFLNFKYIATNPLWQRRAIRVGLYKAHPSMSAFSNMPATAYKSPFASGVPSSDAPGKKPFGCEAAEELTLISEITPPGRAVRPEATLRGNCTAPESVSMGPVVTYTAKSNRRDGTPKGTGLVLQIESPISYRRAASGSTKVTKRTSTCPQR